MKIHVVYLPLARTTFSMPDAEGYFKKSCTFLEPLFEKLSRPTDLLTSPEMLGKFADSLIQPDLIIYQCSTFIGSDFVIEITRRFNCPVIVWAVREPSIDGGRLKLNSLTGAFSAANSLYLQGRNYKFIFGNPEERSVMEKIRKIGKALEMIKKLKNLVIGVIGTQPAGFGFGSMDEAQLAGKFGAKIVQMEAAGIMVNAASYSSDEFSTSLNELKDRTKGWELLPKVSLEKYARLCTAYYDFINKNELNAIASRCWPDFFVSFGAPVCSVLSMLNDNGIPASCETDIGGAISMFIGSGFSGEATYLGDPVAIDESCDGIVYWHCGAGATCLSREKDGPKLGIHPNRKIGPTMEFGLKDGPVTVLRLGKDRNGFRMFVMKGTALDEPNKFFGTSVTVRPSKGNPSEKIAEFVRDGWEPHFVIAYGDIVEELRIMCDFLNISLWEN